jgi:photosystem II stability/assembly factor-like uncharacterized protein
MVPSKMGCFAQNIRLSLSIGLTAFLLPQVSFPQPVAWQFGEGSLRNSASAIAIPLQGSDTLFALCTREFLKSTTHGQTWDSISWPWSAGGALRIDPLDQRNLLVVSDFWDASALRKSTNGGVNWQVLIEGNWWTTCILEPHPTEPRTIFIGVGPHRLFKTTDFAETWDTLAYPCSVNAGFVSLSVASTNPDIMYAGSGTGITRSTDGGRSWIELVLPVPCSRGVRVRVDPVDDQVIYAAIYSSGTPPGGMYKSTDGGASWMAINTGLNSRQWEIGTLVIHPQRHTEIYIGIVDRSGGRHTLFRSSDAGTSWQAYDYGLPTSGSGSISQGIAFDTSNNRMYCGAATAGPPADTAGIFFLDLGSTDVDPENRSAAEFELLQNYPNPFNSSTMVQFRLAHSGHVDIRVFDILGREVLQQSLGWLELGSHAVSVSSLSLTTGTYLFQLTNGGRISQKKMLVIR